MVPLDRDPARARNRYILLARQPAKSNSPDACARRRDRALVSSGAEWRVQRLINVISTRPCRVKEDGKQVNDVFMN